MGAQPARAQICEEKRRLSDEVLLAVREVVRLQNEEIQELIRGGPVANDTQAASNAIIAARQKWDEAKHVYLQHVHAHGC